MTIWTYLSNQKFHTVRTIQIVEAKAHFSALLAAVEAGETVAITRHGKVVARLVPDTPSSAADVFRPFWTATSEANDQFDVTAPEDLPPEPAVDF
jgi:prevent-host-death family protein